MRLTEGGPEIYCYSNSFGIKDQLNARGWKFQEYSHPNDGFLGLSIAMTGRGTIRPPSMGWGLVRSSTELFQAELEWMIERGWGITHVQSGVSSILQSVLEGREDLLNPQLPISYE